MFTPSPPVSIVTVTQGSRIAFLRIQAENIGSQTYGNIKEWVVVDGSSNAAESSVLHMELRALRFPRQMNIVYNPYTAGTRPKIGALRNMANQLATGTIIVNMDDDDYYCPSFVHHAVQTLLASPKRAPVAGCGPVYMYDLRWNTVFQAKKFNDDHACNNMIAFTKDYADANRYDESVDYAEEPSFLKWQRNTIGGGTPVEQMDPSQCGVHLCHGKNTYNKQSIVLGALCDLDSGAYREKSKNIYDFIPLDCLRKYEALRGPPGRCIYDIVVFCGGWSNIWNPVSTDLVEAEAAIVKLASHWVLQGFTVAVYGEVGSQSGLVHAGVQYFHTLEFDPYQAFDILILWRNYGICPVSNMHAPLTVNILILDLHDNLEISYHAVKKILDIDYYRPRTKVVFKSEFHKSEYTAACGPISNDAYCIIPSGIEPCQIAHPPPPRLPWRFCYSLDYRRGLVDILEKLWPHVIALEPRAELHVFIPEYFDDQTYQTVKTLILKTKGVCDHGPQSLQHIAYEKHVSWFDLAVTDARGEVDCVSVKQSAAIGCTPLLLNTCVYKELNGIHFNPLSSYENIAKDIATCIKLQTSTPPAAQPTWYDTSRLWIVTCFDKQTVY